MKKRVLFFSADPGGAECLIPVMQALPREMKYLLMCKGHATRYFKECFQSFLKIDNLVFAKVETVLDNYSIDAVVTSASSLPEKDATEKLLWRWAKKKAIPSIAILDQWQNYARRFSGVDDRAYLAYLPDKIAIMDKLAKKDMLEEGFPSNKLHITGQPAIERFRGSFIELKKKQKAARPNNLKNDFAITFFSQPIRSFFKNTIEYNESDVLKDILSVISSLEKKWERNIKLICKLHPKNTLKDFAAVEIESGKNFKFVRDEYSNHELVASSDIVLGVDSVMMINSVLAGIPTLSYMPGKPNTSIDCMPARIGAISGVTTKKDLMAIINRMKTDRAFLNNYLKKQKRCAPHRGAANNVIALLKHMLHEK